MNTSSNGPVHTAPRAGTHEAIDTAAKQPGTTSGSPRPRDDAPGDVPDSAASAGSRNDDTVTAGMRIAAAWSWRFVVIVAAIALIYYGLGYLSEIAIPVTVALMLCALLSPAKRFLVAHGWKPGMASTGVFVGGVLVVAGVVTLVIEQFVAGAPDLADRVTAGLDTVQNWLVTGPFRISQDQINSATTSIKEAVVANQETATSGAVSTATSVGKVVTGLILVMFILFFFLRDGKKIWDWLAGSPRGGHDRASMVPATAPGPRSADTSEPPCWLRSSTPSASAWAW